MVFIDQPKCFVPTQAASSHGQGIVPGIDLSVGVWLDANFIEIYNLVSSVGESLDVIESQRAKSSARAASGGEFHAFDEKHSSDKETQSKVPEGDSVPSVDLKSSWPSPTLTHNVHIGLGHIRLLATSSGGAAASLQSPSSPFSPLL